MSSLAGFDPRRIIEALERNRVNYVLIGDLAGVLHGTDEIADSVEIAPQMKGENLDRLAAALSDLSGVPQSAARLQLDSADPVEGMASETTAGRLVITPHPAGSKGWEDIRRLQTRESLGGGLRAPVASLSDLGRLMSSLGRQDDRDRLAVLRRLAELESRRSLER